MGDKEAEGALESEGSEGVRWLRGLLGLIGLWGQRELWRLRWMRGCYIYIFRLFGHHGNRLYGFMDILAKSVSGWMGDWMDTP